MKTYSPAPDAAATIEKIQAQHHEALEGATVSALFVFDTETTLPVLKHQGYAAGAVVRGTRGLKRMITHGVPFMRRCHCCHQMRKLGGGKINPRTKTFRCAGCVKGRGVAP